MTLDESLGPDELVPCPTCWLHADLLPPPPYESFHHSRCPKGHDNTLVPSVLAHLRAMGEEGYPKTA